MPEPAIIAIYGAGGFGREMANMLAGTAYRHHHLVAFIDDLAEPDARLHGLPVMTPQALQSRHPAAEVVMAIGHSTTRQRLAQVVCELGLTLASPVHESALLSDSVSVGEGAIVCQQVVMTVDISLGPHVHVNLGCTVGHDVSIGAYSTLAPGVNVSGNVTIGSGVWIATGVSIINGTSDKPLHIGDGSVVGAGAAVTRDIPAHSLYAGVPAVFKKDLSDP